MRFHHKLISLLLVASLSVGTVAQDAKPAQKVGGTSYDQKSAMAKGDTVSETSKSIWGVFQDKNNNYWFGSNGQGVYRYDGKSMTQFTTKHGLPGDQIRGVQQHKSGDILINTTKGISRYNGRTFTTFSAIESKPLGDGWKLQADDLWFGGAQNTGAVYRYDGETLHRLALPKTKRGEDNYVEVPRDKFPNAKYSPYDIYTIYKDRRGSIWFGTAVAGACRYDGKSFDWLYEDHLTNTPEGGSFGIRSIFEDKDGKFWICNTKYRFNVSVKNPFGTGTGLIHYTREKGIAGLKLGDGDDYFYFAAIHENDKGDLWLVNYGGIFRYDGKSTTFYPVKDGGKEALTLSIYQDNRGDLWLGTDNAGAYKFNGKAFEKFGDQRAEFRVQ